MAVSRRAATPLPHRIGRHARPAAALEATSPSDDAASGDLGRSSLGGANLGISQFSVPLRDPPLEERSFMRT